MADDWRGEIDGWNEAQREAWEERAAIIEYEAGVPRPAAEWDAWKMIREKEGKNNA